MESDVVGGTLRTGGGGRSDLLINAVDMDTL